MENLLEFTEMEKDLRQAGEPSKITPQILKMDSFRITSDSDIPKEDYLFNFYNNHICPRKNISCITGSPKSGKTLFDVMLMACCARPHILNLTRITEEPLKVLWLDTEQSENTTKEIMVGRIQKMIDVEEFPDERYFVFNVVSATIQERRDMLMLAIETYHPDIVFIDGIADLVEDINDGRGAAELMNQLLNAAKNNNCNIIVNIHLNRTGDKANLRGMLGTQVLQKAYEVFNCASIPQCDTLSVELTFSRRSRSGQKMYYTLDDSGMPYITKKPNILSSEITGETDVDEENPYAFNREYLMDDPEGEKSYTWNLQKLFSDAMGTAATLGYDDLRKRAMALGNIKKLQYYYKILREAEAKHIVAQTMDSRKRVVITLLPQ